MPVAVAKPDRRALCLLSALGYAGLHASG